MTKDKEQSLQAVLDKVVDGKKVFGTSFALKKDGETWLGASGNLTRPTLLYCKYYETVYYCYYSETKRRRQVNPRR